MVHENGGGVCLWHRQLHIDSNHRGKRLKSMVGSDLQQCRCGFLEFRHYLYGPNSVGSSWCNYPGFTYWSDQRYHTHLYVECGLWCKLVLLICQ